MQPSPALPGRPATVEIIAVMRSAGETNQAIRLRGLIVVLWHAGLRIRLIWRFPISVRPILPADQARLAFVAE